MKKNKTDPPGPGAPRRRPAPRAAGGGGGTAPPRRGKSAPRPFSADELRRIGAEITAEWFRPVEAGGLTLLEVDPWRAHAYWHLAGDALDAARANLPGGRDAALVLRFTDLSPGAASPAGFDIEVHGAANNWYVDLWRDARRYAAELGLRAADGTFVGLARSNEVETPRGGPSPELDFRRLEVRAPRPGPVGAPSRGQPGQAARVPDLGAILLRELFPKRLPLDEGFPLARADSSGARLDEPAFPALARNEDFEAATVAVEPASSPAHGHPDDFPRIEAAEIEPYRDLARQAEARALAGLPTRLPPVAPEAIAPGGLALTPRPLPIRPARAPGGDPAGPVPDAAGAGAPAGPAIPLDALLAGAVFSPGHGEPTLRAVADLVIRGRGEPGRRLRLFGERLTVDADGGFTVRLPIEHGPELAALLSQLRDRPGDKGLG